MKMLPLIALISLALNLPAQDALSRGEAIKFAAMLNFDLDKLTDTPIPTDADIKRPFGLKGDSLGGLVIPEAKLTGATLDGAGKQVVPVGQLWLVGLVPAKGGHPIAKDKLKVVTVQDGARDVTLPLFVLGVRKGAGDRLELLVFGKGKSPLLTVPFVQASHEQKWPLELTVERKGDAVTQVVLLLVGKYEASIPVTLPLPPE